MNSCCCAHLHVEESAGAKLHVEDAASMSLDVGGDFYAVGPPYYDGSYDITPCDTAQVIHMDGMRAAHDIIIEPIPSNYGLITYDGSVITVS